MANKTRPQARPLSPHLQVYRWRVHMLTSILHRATGTALSIGTVLLTIWFAALASGSEAFGAVQSLLASPLGLLVMIGFSFALLQHMGSGIRHLFMDTGALYELGANRTSAVLTYVFSVTATAALWAFVFLA